jgi:hypothetical protein
MLMSAPAIPKIQGSHGGSEPSSEPLGAATKVSTVLPQGTVTFEIRPVVGSLLKLVVRRFDACSLLPRYMA